MELREIAGIFDNARTRPSYAIKRLFHRYCLRHRSNFSTFLRFSLLPFLPYYYYYYYSLLSKKFRLHFLASLGNLENWKWKKCVNLFRINRISILFRDIRAMREFHWEIYGEIIVQRRIMVWFLAHSKSHWSELSVGRVEPVTLLSDRFSRHRFAWGTFACTIDNLVYRPVMTSLLSYSRADYFLEV